MQTKLLVPAAAVIALATSSASRSGVDGAEAPSAAFTVAPLRIDMAATQEATQLRLVNAAASPSAVQIRVFAWRQADGRDVYAPSTDIIVSPSIVRLAPHGIQVIHLVRGDAVTPSEERRYRVVIDELPTTGSAASVQTATRLQLTLPLFVAPDSGDALQLDATVADGKLTIANAGGRTARIAALALVAADGRRWPVPLAGGRYVHGGSAMRYPVPAFDCRDAGPVRVEGQVDQADYRATPAQSCA